MASASTHRKKAKLFRYFGFFYCPKCKNSWRSAHVNCEPDTLEVKYKQRCQQCKKFYKPYKIEAIRCRNCGEAGKDCHCERKGRGRPENKHRQSLCEKCLQGCSPCHLSSYPKGPAIELDEEEEDYDDDIDDDDDDYDRDSENDECDYERIYGGCDENDSDFEALSDVPEEDEKDEIVDEAFYGI